MGSLYFPVFPKISSNSRLSLVVLSLQLLLLSQTFFYSFALSNSTSCLHHHKVALLQLKQGFSTNRGKNNSSSKLDSWNPATDCCTWDGISCDEVTGNVIGLDLSSDRSYDVRSGSWIEGRIDSSLFQLPSLQTLDLSDNDFSPNPIPSGLGQLINLTHLNLFSSGFYGQIPLEISRLTKLVSLDLSGHYFLELRNPNLTALIGNLSSLEELFLDYVNIVGEHGGEWAESLSTALPNLRKLSLSSCNLQGPIGTSLFRVPFLSVLSLHGNNLSIAVPDFLGNSTALAFLNLRDCNLHGKFPESIFLLPNLNSLWISYNPYLAVHLPEFPEGSALQVLHMDDTNIHQKVPDSIGNLKLLKELSIRSCSLYGLLPSSIGNLTQLVFLGLSSNNLSGTIPSTFGDELQHLEHLYLEKNSLDGSIPSSVFSIPTLQLLDLSDNDFIGTVGLHMFQNLKNLFYFDISNNNLSFININGSSALISSQIRDLNLCSCNIREFPIVLQSLNLLERLDLSNNKIHGKIPSWTWKLGNGNLRYLNLSNNFLESFEHPLPDFSLSRLEIVDLHSNRLQGLLPVLSSRLRFHDYSNNNFSSTVPVNMNFTSTRFFFISDNKISGRIPFSICNARQPEVLDLSKNSFSSTIPSCLGKASPFLKILNLRRNSLQGNIPDIFRYGCKLKSLNLYENQLEGPIPRSLVNCKALEVLDLGRNHLNDTFPFWLKDLSTFRILILRSNKFHGPIVHLNNKPMPSFLQIFDLSSNSFMGTLPIDFFFNWKAMGEEDDSRFSSNDQIVSYRFGAPPYYQDSVTIVMKGLYVELVKILKALKSVDLSNNMFQGEISESIGSLKFLRVLNFSENNFLGSIPVSLENLTLLESLDLSKNKLSGEIPQQLLKLTFLGVLNLSQNLLFGSIPQGNQFFTFKNDSFLGNIGLCGPPLSKKCGDTWATPPSPLDSLDSNDVEEIDWRFMWIGLGVGFGVGFGAVFWTLALWRKGSRKFAQLIDRIFFKFSSFFQ